MLAPSYQSSILTLGPNQETLSALGSEFVDSPKLCLEALEAHGFKALVLHESKFTNENSLKDFLIEKRKAKHDSQVILLADSFVAKDIIPLLNQGLLQQVTHGSKAEVEIAIQKAIQDFDKMEQDHSFFRLFDEQNERLSMLKLKLEERVEKRQRFLNSARAKLSRTDRNVGLLHKCFVAIHQSQSLHEIERRLKESLEQDFQIHSIRISTNKEEPSPTKDNEERVLSFVLVAEDREFGQIQFTRDIRQPFSSQEEDLLEQISDAVSLAAKRILVLVELESLTNQWEITFNAISDPLCLLDEDLNILRANVSLAELTKTQLDQLNGKNPFKLLELTRLIPQVQSAAYRSRAETTLQGEHFVFDVIVQKLTGRSTNPILIAIFRDVTQTTQLEKQALESSKMAELGIIGSSIAHELNNPLGGIINFLQLIKMDLPEGSAYTEDFDEMETAANRCKDIVESLLGFARKEEDEEAQEFEISQAIDQAIRICEIQTKTKGIRVEWNSEDFSDLIVGHKNQWIQVLRNILQNSIDAIERRSKKEKSLQGKIDIRKSVKKNDVQVLIQDNGDGIAESDMSKIFNPLFSRKDDSEPSGLGLTIAFRILSEHGANLFFKSKPTSGTTAIISLKSPEIQGSSQVFDTKI